MAVTAKAEDKSTRNRAFVDIPFQYAAAPFVVLNLSINSPSATRGRSFVFRRGTTTLKNSRAGPSATWRRRRRPRRPSPPASTYFKSTTPETTRASPTPSSNIWGVSSVSIVTLLLLLRLLPFGSLSSSSSSSSPPPLTFGVKTVTKLTPRSSSTGTANTAPPSSSLKVTYRIPPISTSSFLPSSPPSMCAHTAKTSPKPNSGVTPSASPFGASHRPYLPRTYAARAAWTPTADPSGFRTCVRMASMAKVPLEE
mmetsp:Transcript_18356/g.37087  ORF Transcript_18356/g.37087 Transcript_18356/m.37087 type:complete len:254 (-) Transcript_18356:399-1160(-)